MSQLDQFLKREKNYNFIVAGKSYSIPLNTKTLMEIAKVHEMDTDDTSKTVVALQNILGKEHFAELDDALLPTGLMKILETLCAKLQIDKVGVGQNPSKL